MFRGTGLMELISYINKITKNHKNRLNILGDKSELWADLRKIKEMSRQVKNFSLEFVDINQMQPHRIEEYYDFYTKDLKEIKSTFKHLLENKVCFKYSEKTRTKEKYNLYTYLLQNIGNNLRCCNDPFDDSTEFDEKKFEAYLKRINNLIKIIKRCFIANQIVYDDNWTESLKQMVDNVLTSDITIFHGGVDSSKTFKLNSISNDNKRAECGGNSGSRSRGN